MFEYCKKSSKLIREEFKRKVPLLLMSYLMLSLCESVGIALVFPIIAVLVDPSTIENTSLYNKYVVQFLDNSIQSIIPFLPVVMMGTFALKNLAAIFINKWQISLVNNEASNNSIEVFKKYAKMSYLSSHKRDTSFLNFTILSASNIFYNSYITPAFLVVSEIITMTILIIFLIGVDIKIAIIALASSLSFGYVIFAFTKNKLKKIGKENQFYGEKLIRTIKEVFSNFKEFKILGREERFEFLFGINREKTNQNQSHQMIFQMLNKNVIEILSLLGVGGIAFFVIANNSKAVALAQLGLYAIIVVRLMPSITRISASLQTMKASESAIDLLYEEQNYFLEPQNSTPYVANCKNIEFIIDKPIIRFQNVYFSYPESQDFVLKDVSFEIPPHTSVGIVGKTGSGKTTLADIILGLILPSKGNVYINDIPFHDVFLQWRKCLGYVPQKISFMNATLLENIAYGIPRDNIDLARIDEVIEIAQLAYDIKTFDHGLNTMISEDGGNLSGGQKQRIGIARALYNNPSILVLDEATSSLDVETEAKISDAIHKIKKSCTLIIIAHRLSTIRKCDNIFYIEQGNLIAQGNFEALSKSNDKFKNIVELSSLPEKVS